MPDILIGRPTRHGRVYILPETPKGRQWMLANTMCVITGTAVHVIIGAEHKEDFINNLKEAELTYNEE